MRMLYKYPQAEFPYKQLLEENQRRGRANPEFELLDTGVFTKTDISMSLLSMQSVT